MSTHAWLCSPRRGMVLPGLAAAAVVYGAGALLVMTHPKVLAAVVVAIAAAGCAVLAALFTSGATATAGWWSACGAVTAGWLGYAAVEGPGSWPAVAGLLVPAAVLIWLWSVVKAHEEHLAEVQQRRQAEMGLAAERQKWPAL